MRMVEEQLELKADAVLLRESVDLVYKGLATAQVRGTVTGRLYQFSKTSPKIQVDLRDAATMLQYSFLQRVS